MLVKSETSGFQSSITDQPISNQVDSASATETVDVGSSPG